jgi:hypothetical protein
LDASCPALAAGFADVADVAEEATTAELDGTLLMADFCVAATEELAGAEGAFKVDFTSGTRTEEDCAADEAMLLGFV